MGRLRESFATVVHDCRDCLRAIRGCTAGFELPKVEVRGRVSRKSFPRFSPSPTHQQIARDARSASQDRVTFILRYTRGNTEPGTTVSLLEIAFETANSFTSLLDDDKVQLDKGSSSALYFRPISPHRAWRASDRRNETSSRFPLLSKLSRSPDLFAPLFRLHLTYETRGKGKPRLVLVEALEQPNFDIKREDDDSSLSFLHPHSSLFSTCSCSPVPTSSLFSSPSACWQAVRRVLLHGLLSSRLRRDRSQAT